MRRDTDEAWLESGGGRLHELARLEEATGDLDAARAHYRQYLEHWGKADLPIVNVRDAQVRLKRSCERDFAGGSSRSASGSLLSWAAWCAHSASA